MNDPAAAAADAVHEVDEVDEGRCSGCERHLEVGARFCAGCGRRATGPQPRERAGAVLSTVDAAATVTTSPRHPTDAHTTASTGRIPPRRVAAEPAGRSEASASARAGASRCVSCGATNVASRMLCGACGLDLATGDPQLTVRPAPADAGAVPTVPAPVDGGESAAIPWWVPAVAAVLVLVVVAGAIIGLGLGPFEARAEAPSADFEASGYPGEPEPLTLTGVAALTFRAPVEGRTFTPDHLVDGDPTTAWHGEASTLPVGTDEKIDLILTRPAWVAGVIIDNGDQLDADAYASTSRVQRAMLVFDGGVRVPVTLLDQGLEPQIVELEEPLLTVAVRIEILETVAGTERQEVAVSRLELLGYPAEGDDILLAEERMALLPAAGSVPVPG